MKSTYRFSSNAMILPDTVVLAKTTQQPRDEEYRDQENTD